MIIIKTLHFENYEDFACAVSDTYDRVKSDDEYNSVDIVAKYEDVKEIIRELVGIGYGIAFATEFASPEWDNYDDAFVVSLLDDEIWCEPVKRKDGYIFVEANVVYIFDDCNSKIIPKIEADEVYEVEVGNEYDDYDDCDGDCENCEYHDMTTTSSASYKVNGKSVDRETYEKTIEDIEEKYLDGIRDMLLRYCEIQDEMNEWRKLLNW